MTICPVRSSPWLRPGVHTAALLMLACSPVMGTDTPAAMSPAPHRQTWEESMTVDTTQQIKELPEPADATERKQAFSKRNDPAQRAHLAKHLWAMWDHSERSAGNTPNTDWLDPEKAHIVELFGKQDYDAALDAFRTYFIRKCQIFYFSHPSNYSSNEFNSRFNTPLLTKRYLAMTDLLMHNAYQVPVTKETVRYGEPGLAHWEWKASATQNLWDNLFKPQIEYFGGSDFDKLWWRFVDTKDRRYLDKWLAYLDDYCLNDHTQENLSALNLDLGKQGIADAVCFFQALVQISNALPGGSEQIPSTTVARMLVHLLDIVVPQSSFYNRQQSNNHSPGTSGSFMLLSDYLSDFSIAKTLVNESRRQFEIYGTMDARPDGSGPGRLPEYVMFEYRMNLPTIDYIKAGDFPWFTPMLNREYRDRMVARERYVVHMISPQGEYIDSQKNDDRRRIHFDYKVGLFNNNYPEVFNDPDISRIVYQIFKNMAGPDYQGKVPLPPETPIANMGMGSAADDKPRYTSLSFPYDRINIMSSGFDPKNDQYGVLLGSSATGRGDAMMKENKATNHFVISAFDRDIFRNGVNYAYNYLSSPVLVDGQQQFNGAGEGPTARKGAANYGLDKIDPDRLYYSEDFDLAESTYNWAYVTTGGHDPQYYDYRTKLDNLKKAIRGISHHRIVQFVKKHGLWIVTDVMHSQAPRTYAQQWWLDQKGPKATDGWLVAQIHADDATHTIITAEPNNVNFSMYHLGPVEQTPAATPSVLHYDAVQPKPEPIDPFQGARSDRHEGQGFVQLRGSWSSPGGYSQLVTVIYPRKHLSDALTSFEPHKRDDGQTDGFTATLPDGSTVSYLAAVDNPRSLQLGPFTAQAESMLVVHEPAGGVSGTVLGCTSIVGQDVARTGADFAFAVHTKADGSTDEIIHKIHHPIQAVVIAPGVDGFLGAIDVTMQTPTTGTRIHYTTDGNDPTLDSALYTQPLHITDTVMVKARAFRDEVVEMPPETPTDTLMSEVSTAVYTKQLLHQALPATNTSPGLTYTYYEAKWPYFIYGVNPSIEPLQSGEVAKLFDTSPKSADNTQAFAFVYQGYLSIPTDGVYTIYAPDEFIHYRPFDGYDLDLSLGYQIQSDDRGGSKVPQMNSPLEKWYPATRRHAYGSWSVALQKGLQPIRVYFADMRRGATLQYLQYQYPGWNVPGLTHIIWDGDVPHIEISGPNLTRQSIPDAWYQHDAK